MFPFYADYFKMPYGFPKLDLIALEEFNIGINFKKMCDKRTLI